MTAKKKSTSPLATAAAAKETAKKVGLRLQGSATEGVIIVLLAACVFLLLALFSFNSADPGWSSSGPETEVSNWMGPVGAWLADVLYSLFGVSALWWPGMLGFAAWWLIRSRQVRIDWDATALAVRCGGLVLLLLGSTTLGALYFYDPNSPLPYSTGGILGEGLAGALRLLVGTGGTGLLAVAGILCGLPLFTGLSWFNVIDEMGHRALSLIQRFRRDAGTELEQSKAKTDDVPSPESAEETGKPHWWQRLLPSLRKRRDSQAPDLGDSRKRQEPAFGNDGNSEIPWDVPEQTPSAKQPGAAYTEQYAKTERKQQSRTGSQKEALEPTLGSAFSSATPEQGKEPDSDEPRETLPLRAERTEPQQAPRMAPEIAPEGTARAAREQPSASSSNDASPDASQPVPTTEPAAETVTPESKPVAKPRISVHALVNKPGEYKPAHAEVPFVEEPQPADKLQSVEEPQAIETLQSVEALQPVEELRPVEKPQSGPESSAKDVAMATAGVAGTVAAAAVLASREGEESTPESSHAFSTPEAPKAERRAEDIPEPVLPDDDFASDYVASAPSAPLHGDVRKEDSADGGGADKAHVSTPLPASVPPGTSSPQASQPPGAQGDEQVVSGRVATAEQAREAAEAGGPTLWTVEHLQSQRPGLDDLPEPDGEVPSMRLLTPPEPHQPNYTPEQLQDMAELLEMRLREYGVKAEVVDTWPGPVITRFEIKPAAGVKVSKISNLAKDLARSLMVKSVRVVEVIPGRPTVGIEIPNPNRAMIRLREVIDSERFLQEASPLTLALGQDIGGAAVIANLGKMPHVLVAGTTGSGKSVGVNAMLISMLLKATPSELRLIMVDPKMLELSVYDGIPHLLAPVVTDMKEAANSLRWCVAEMERRYKLMAAMGVRNIAGFNSKLDEAERHGAQVADPLWEPQPWEMHQTPPVLEKLPYIVVVIDEFADMFMIVGKKVEELIARLAQKARAAGIHLVLATQRPSVDVVTGLIKANIPTRMAFQVSSRVDSRTILDQGGAENLLGHGDMLYLPAGSGQPTRVHGAFVDDDEVHRVVEDWKRRGEPEYIDEILSGGVSADALTGLEADGAGDDGDAEQDALYDEAVAFVTESRRASISAVQRRFKIGYNRAARLVESMEMAGVVSQMGSNGAREVLAPPPVGS